jgi:hypothetical protein
MLFKKEIVLRDIFIVKVGDANIEQDIQKQREIKQGKVHPVTLISHHILNCSVDSKNPKWFDYQIESE